MKLTLDVSCEGQRYGVTTGKSYERNWKQFCMKTRNWKNLSNLCKWLFLSYFFLLWKMFPRKFVQYGRWLLKKKKKNETRRTESQKGVNESSRQKNNFSPLSFLKGNALFYYCVIIIAIISLLFHIIIWLIVLQPLVPQIPAVVVGNVQRQLTITPASATKDSMDVTVNMV